MKFFTLQFRSLLSCLSLLKNNLIPTFFLFLRHVHGTKPLEVGSHIRFEAYPHMSRGRVEGVHSGQVTEAPHKGTSLVGAVSYLKEITPIGVGRFCIYSQVIYNMSRDLSCSILHTVLLGPVHTNVDSKVYGFVLPKTHQLIRVHTTVFKAFPTVHTNTPRIRCEGIA